MDCKNEFLISGGTGGFSKVYKHLGLSFHNLSRTEIIFHQLQEPIYLNPLLSLVVDERYMKQAKLHNQIRSLYKRYPELVNDNRLLEFIMLTCYDDMFYLMTHKYEDLKYVLSDRRVTLNDYRDAPPLEGITRAARKVRERMRTISNLDQKIELARLQKEIEYRKDYNPKQMKVFDV